MISIGPRQVYIFEHNYVHIIMYLRLPKALRACEWFGPGTYSPRINHVTKGRQVRYP